MGLAAVPFGTAQVHGNTEYKIEVKKKETDEGRHFSIGVKCFSEKKCFLRPEVIEIDWAKNNDAVLVRFSKHDAKSIFRFCDVVTKENAALGYDHKKFVRGSVHVLSFLVREFPFESDVPFQEALRCDLIFNPHPVGKQEEVLLVVKSFIRKPSFVRILSDIPTVPQGKNNGWSITNHLCPFDKLPLFLIGGGGFLGEDNEMFIFLDNSVGQITDEEMRRFAKKYASVLIRTEGDNIVGFASDGYKFIGREEFQKEHSDYFEVRDAFSSDLIKDGKVYLSDVPEDKCMDGVVFFKIHNDTNGVVNYSKVLFIEPHGMLPMCINIFFPGILTFREKWVMIGELRFGSSARTVNHRKCTSSSRE